MIKLVFWDGFGYAIALANDMMDSSEEFQMSTFPQQIEVIPTKTAIEIL